MGFLKAGIPLEWPDSLQYIEYVRKHGVDQFLKTFFRVKDRKNDVLKWGDEIEYHTIELDETDQRARIALVAPQVLEQLELEDKETNENASSPHHQSNPAITSGWRPEYGAWMVEATPGAPYGNRTADLHVVLPNMAERRRRITATLQKLCPDMRIVASSLVSFPMMGVGDDFVVPKMPTGGPFSRSLYFSDGAICPHPRFGTLTANIRRRRGERVNILLPLFQDVKTDLSRPVTLLDNNSKQLSDDQCETRWSNIQTKLYRAKIDSESSMLRAVPQDRSPSKLQRGTQEDTECDAKSLPSNPEHDVAVDTNLTEKLDELSDEKTLSLQRNLLPPGYVHLDAMGFGMGCCCLQVTFQARDLAESRYLYDQLAIMAPLVLALTANTPVVRGRLVDVDTRWDIIAASVDCRTPSERLGRFGMGGLPDSLEVQTARARHELANSSDESFATSEAAELAQQSLTESKAILAESSSGDGVESRDTNSSIATFAASSATADVGQYPLAGWQTLCNSAASSAGAGSRAIPKSRYDSIDVFISDSPAMRPEYNDLPVVVDQQTYDQLSEAGVDTRLARHIAHLFIRDPLVMFSDRIEVDDEATTEHFENIQSTNWHSVRWKPPPCDEPDMGWRVELRTMEAQLTDFENAAFTVFTVLLSRVILFFDLDLYIPISKVDENFARARKREAATQERFHFRTHVVPLDRHVNGRTNMGHPTNDSSESGASTSSTALDYAEMSLEEILLGHDEFPGLIPLIFAYLDIIKCDADTKTIVDVYMRLVADRARGLVQTGATWQREFIRSHSEYNFDSVVTPQIAYDLLEKCAQVVDGSCQAPELLGMHAFEVQNALRQRGPNALFAKGLGARLRGASFAEEIASAQDCAVVRDLVSKYAMQPGKTFESTPAFLSGLAAK